MNRYLHIMEINVLSFYDGTLLKLSQRQIFNILAARGALVHIFCVN